MDYKNRYTHVIKNLISCFLVICIILTSVQIPVFSSDSFPENSKVYLDEDISSSGDENEIIPDNAESPETSGDEEISSGEIEFPDNAFSKDLFIDGDIGITDPVEVFSDIDPDSDEEIGADWSDIEDLIEDSVSVASNSEEIVGSINQNPESSASEDFSTEALNSDEIIEEIEEESNNDLVGYPNDYSGESEEYISEEFQGEKEQEPSFEIIDERNDEEVTGSSDDIGLSEISLSVQVGKSTSVTASTGNVNYPVYLTAYKVDSDMVSTSWGNWYDNGKKINLTITGRKEGKTYIYVYMKRASNDAVIASSRILVTVKGNPVLYASESSITLNQGSAKKVTMSYGGTSGTVYMSFAVSDNSVARCEWGNWSGSTIPITVTGLKAGNTQITIRLCDANTKEVLSSKAISVSVRATPRLTVSKSNTTINAGYTDNITITVTNCNGGALKYGVTNSSVVSCAWGGQNGMSATLKITGKAGGQAVIYVYLYDSSRQNVLAQTSINVTVISQPKVTASTNNLSVKVDETKNITFTVTDMNGVFHLGYSLNSDRYVDCRWANNWSGNSIILYISGKNTGTVSLKVTLFTGDGRAVTSTTVNINVNPSDSPRIALSNSNLTIKKNQTGTIYVYFYNINIEAYLEYGNTNSSVISCGWGGISSNYVPLNVKGLSAGNSNISIYLKRSRDNGILASATANVTVQENDSVISEMSYSYPNFSEAASYSLCRYMFGDTTFAHYVYEERLGQGGNCFGFATTSGMFYVPGNNVNVNTFNSRASIVSELNRTDRNSSLGLTSKEFVMAMQTSQVAPQFSGKRNFVSTDRLGDLISAVNSQMSLYRRPVVISIYGYGGGHAILAYKVEQVSSTETHVYVIDSNHPLKSRYITIRKNSSGQFISWSYDMGGYGMWGTGYTNPRIAYTYYPDYLKLWNNRGNLSYSNLNMIAANTDDFILKDVNNDVIATVKDGVLETQNKDIFMVDLTEIKTDDNVLLYVPVKLYSFQNTNADLDELNVNIVNVDLGAQIKTTADEVCLCADDEYSITSALIPNAKGESYDITLNSSREGDTQSINLSGVGNDDVISAVVDNGNLEVCNTEDADLSVGDVNPDRKDISSCSISGIANKVYTGIEITPTIKIKDGEYTLVLNQDYTIKYSNNVNVGTATAKIAGIGKYKGERSVSFSITKAAAKLTFEKANISKKTTDTEFVNELQRATDGSITYSSSNTDVATVNKYTGKVTIKGVGTTIITAKAATGYNYKSTQAEYTLEVSEGQKDISKASVAGVSLSYGYSGKSYTPSLTVKVDGVTLIKDKDYTVKYENNKNPGTATITITGKGNYTGNRIKTFEIVNCVSSLVSGKTYQIIPKNNSQTAVCSFSGKMVNNTKVYITDRSNSEAMKFKAVKNSDGTWKFINAKCELALAVQQNSSDVGKGLVLYDQTSKKAQNWKLSKKSDNSFAIINDVSGLSISMSDESAAKGTTLSMAETASVGLQRFYIAETSAVSAPYNGTKSVRASKDKNYALNIASSSKEDGANVNLYTYSNTNAKKFKIMYSGGGYYRLVNINSGLCLSVKGNVKVDGANVIQSKWAAESGQRWKITKNSDGTVTLTNALGTNLHLVSNKTANGTNIVAKTASTSAAQKWYLE